MLAVVLFVLLVGSLMLLASAAELYARAKERNAKLERELAVVSDRLRRHCVEIKPEVRP